MANALGFTHEILTDHYEGQLPARTAWLQKKVDEAVRMLIAKRASIPRRIKSGELDEELVADKVAAAVLRVVRNPSGLSNESEGNYSYGLANRVASGDLWYPDNDLADLDGPPDTGVGSFRVNATPGWGPPPQSEWRP